MGHLLLAVLCRSPAFVVHRRGDLLWLSDYEAATGAHGQNCAFAIRICRFREGEEQGVYAEVGKVEPGGRSDLGGWPGGLDGTRLRM